MRSKTTILVVIVTALVLSLALVEPALAQESKAGDNLANFLQSIAQPLLPAIAGVMCIAALVRRDFGMTMLLLVIVLVAGLFIWAPTELNQSVRSVAKDLANAW